MDAPLVINGVKVNIDDCENFDIKGDFVVNGLNFDDLYIDRFYWVGTDTEKFENSFMLTYLSGVSNTLSQGVFGKYLIESSEDLTVYSECIIDMWGNISYKEFDQNGIATSILNNFQYTISLSENGKENKFEIHGKNT